MLALNTEFGRGQGQIEIIFVALEQRVDHLHAVQLQGRVQAGTSHGVTETLAVGLDDGVHFIAWRIQSLHRLADVPRKRPCAEHTVANLILGLAHALIVAAHAGDAVGDGEILAGGVANDRGRPLVETLAAGLVQIVALESVRQAEHCLTAIMVETSAAWPEWKREQVLPVAIAGKIIRRPEVAAARRMSLDQAVVLADPGFLETGALRHEIADIGLDIDTLVPRQFLEGGRQPQQHIVQRRLRCREDEPVGSQVSQRSPRAARQRRIDLGVGLDIVGVDRKQAIPVRRAPAKIEQIEAQDGGFRIDGLQLHHIRRATQGIQELDRALAIHRHCSRGCTGVGQVRQRQIARRRPARHRLPVEVGGHEADHRFRRDQLVALAGGGCFGAERRNPGLKCFQIALRQRAVLGFAFIIHVVRHLLVRDLAEQLGSERIARQHIAGIGGNLFEFQDIAEVLGRPLAIDQLAFLMTTRAIPFQDIEGGCGDGIRRRLDSIGCRLAFPQRLVLSEGRSRHRGAAEQDGHAGHHRDHDGFATRPFELFEHGYFPQGKPQPHMIWPEWTRGVIMS